MTPSPLRFERPIGLREVRLASGIVLALFLLTHFSTHALGLVSVEAMEAGRGWFNVLWRSRPGTILLYGALFTHFGLALHALYRRRTLRMPWREAGQLGLGLLLPFRLVPHVTATRIAFAIGGPQADYIDIVRGLWILNPGNAVRQVIALLVAWTHMCLGFFFWLRAKPWFPKAAIWLYTIALLVPVLALLGFAEAGKEIAGAPDRFGAVDADTAAATLSAIRTALYLGFGFLISATLAARGVRIWRTWATRLRITYPNGRVVAVPRGFSVLEASRAAGIPHASVCGGRGRCSTCRIRITSGLDHQPAPSALEAATLLRIRAGPDTRLACQFRPAHDVAVIPILSAGGNRTTSALGVRAGRGQEREIAVLFCDLRGFTGLSEKRLPFDTVFLLNRYFEVVGHAVEEAGGHLDKFVGDGALALFGLSSDTVQAARQATAAAIAIAHGVEALSRTYASELEHPLAIAMGLHAGPAIVGEMGYGGATTLTAVGDTLNIASRLEGLAKDLDAELVISDDIAQRAALDLYAHERRSLPIRGRSTPVTAWILPTVRDLQNGPGRLAGPILSSE
jgi:adenylate cyclase